VDKQNKDLEKMEQEKLDLQDRMKKAIFDSKNLEQEKKFL